MYICELIHAGWKSLRGDGCGCWRHPGQRIFWIIYIITYLFLLPYIAIQVCPTTGRKAKWMMVANNKRLTGHILSVSMHVHNVKKTQISVDQPGDCGRDQLDLFWCGECSTPFWGQCCKWSHHDVTGNQFFLHHRNLLRRLKPLIEKSFPKRPPSNHHKFYEFVSTVIYKDKLYAGLKIINCPIYTLFLAGWFDQERFDPLRRWGLILEVPGLCEVVLLWIPYIYIRHIACNSMQGFSLINIESSKKVHFGKTYAFWNVA